MMKGASREQQKCWPRENLVFQNFQLQSLQMEQTMSFYLEIKGTHQDPYSSKNMEAAWLLYGMKLYLKPT